MHKNHAQHMRTYRAKLRSERPEYHAVLKAKEAEGTREWRQRLRKETAAAFGGKCQRCGVADLRVLQFDHTKGNGGEHRRSLGWERANNTINGKYNEKRYYDDLVRMNTEEPGSIMLLCANCHLIVAWERKHGRPE